MTSISERFRDNLKVVLDYTPLGGYLKGRVQAAKKTVEFIKNPLPKLKADVAQIKETANKKLTPEEQQVAKAKAVERMVGLAWLGVTGIPRKKIDVVQNYLKTKVSTSVDDLAKVPVKEKFYSALNRFYTATVDKFNPITNITRQAQKTGQIPVGQNPEFLARRYLGVKGISESKLFWKVTSLDDAGNLVDRGHGLSKILEPFKDDLDDLRALLVAERDIELASRGIIGSTPKESRVVLDHLSVKYGKKFSQ